MIPNRYIPKFPLPDGIDSADQYLRMLAMRGMKHRYPNVGKSEIRKRIEYELCVIAKKSCADYFLIIWDALQHARQKGILIGTGRGSSAGSIVNYCLGITQVDPLKFGLLFERFLTPNGCPYIDIDGEERLRDEMLCYLPKRYGKRHVAIIENDLYGIIISSIDIARYFNTTTYTNGEGVEMPMVQAKISDVEDAGFLIFNIHSLDSLTVILYALKNIKAQCNLDLDLSQIPLNDTDTLQLYCKGEAASTFLFSSEGMCNILRKVTSITFFDLVALYCLYRPVPLDWIPKFIARKNSEKPIIYPIAEMESILSETYGITVYQEQIIQAFQTLADFSPNDSNKLRKAFSKRKTVDIVRFKEPFMKTAIAKGYNYDVISRLWQSWETMGCYLFMKSHAVCYTLIAYRTAYLKAHFPKEYMAAYEQSKLSNRQRHNTL